MTPTLCTANTVFRAFADSTRLRLLNLLSEGELCVCELVELLGMVQPKISRHLAYLRRAGLVAVRQEGKWKYYSLPRSTEACTARFWNAFDRVCVRWTFSKRIWPGLLSREGDANASDFIRDHRVAAAGMIHRGGRRDRRERRASRIASGSTRTPRRRSFEDRLDA